jgi:hypothetical protein
METKEDKFYSLFGSKKRKQSEAQALGITPGAKGWRKQLREAKKGKGLPLDADDLAADELDANETPVSASAPPASPEAVGGGNKKKWLIIGGVALGVILLSVVLVMVFKGKNKK